MCLSETLAAEPLLMIVPQPRVAEWTGCCCHYHTHQGHSRQECLTNDEKCWLASLRMSWRHWSQRDWSVILLNIFINVAFERWYVVPKLHSYAGNELVHNADMSTTLRDGPETPFVKMFVGTDTGNSWLSCSLKAAQPEEVSLLLSVSPCPYLVEDANSSIWGAWSCCLSKVLKAALVTFAQLVWLPVRQ